jgi:phosphomevalonate kinase
MMIKEKENGETEIKESKTNIVKTGGKLYIAGEYSVLTPNQSAIIKNIDIFMQAEIKFSEKYSIYSDMYDYSVTLEEDDGNYSLITETVKIINEYLQLKGVDIQPFDMKITGKMEKNGKKYGIGSSGSVTVLTVKAMAKLYSYDISSEELFKLSSYVLLKRGDNGSMGDIACISYENPVMYTSFDRNLIKEKMKNSSLAEIMNLEWGYKIEKIHCPEKYEFLVGWTGIPSISGKMIIEVKNSINNEFLEKSEEIVRNLKNGIEHGNKKIISEKVKENSKLLKMLHEKIYSRKLLELVESAEGLDICAKSSGAGGGDCGIAISFNKNDTEKLLERWESKGIELLYKSEL